LLLSFSKKKVEKRFYMEYFNDTAELLKVAAHPTRLMILSRLADGVLCVSDMEDFLGASQPNISQHLSVMRRSGLVDYYIEGKLRCYFLKDPRVLDILTLLKKKHKKSLPAPACCPARPHARTRRAFN
jgi:DNA-binding transcriptional ArsR family regulator